VRREGRRWWEEPLPDKVFLAVVVMTAVKEGTGKEEEGEEEEKEEGGNPEAGEKRFLELEPPHLERGVGKREVGA